MRYIRHLYIDLSFKLLVKLDALIEALSEAVACLNWITDRLEGFESTSLLFEGRVFSVSIDPLLGGEQVLHESGLELGVDEMLKVAILVNAVLHFVGEGLEHVLGLFQVEDFSVFNHELILEATVL